MSLHKENNSGVNVYVFRSNRYQPLASYGPQVNLAVRETFFNPTLSLERLRDASQDISSINNWPGFQFVLLMHDGLRPRALSFWNNLRVLENFIERHQSNNFAYIASWDPENPWLTGIEGRCIGQVDIHLIDASMPPSNGDVVAWSPPGAVRICEISNVNDLATIQDWCQQIASPSIPRSLAEVSGFQFFSTVQYPENRYVTYLGFRSPEDLDRYLSSDLHPLHDGPFATPEFNDNHRVTILTGQISAWFQRQVG